METSETINEMVAAVKQHAMKNYNNGGWDTIVECYSDKELAEEIQKFGCKTSKEAIQKIGKFCDLYDEKRREIQAEIF